MKTMIIMLKHYSLFKKITRITKDRTKDENGDEK